MSNSSIKASRDDDQVGRELFGDGHDDGSECSKVLDVAHRRAQSAGEGHVDIEAHAGIGPYLVWRTGSREKVAVIVSVDRYEKDVGVGVEDLLSAVAVMDVKVHDEDALNVQTVTGEFGGDCYGIEEAETPTK